MFKTDNHASLRIHCSVFELKQQYSILESNPIDTDTALCDKITKICRAGGNNIDFFWGGDFYLVKKIAILY